MQMGMRRVQRRWREQRKGRKTVEWREPMKGWRKGWSWMDKKRACTMVRV
jgi:hypothetical protein